MCPEPRESPEAEIMRAYLYPAWVYWYDEDASGEPLPRVAKLPRLDRR